MRVIHLLRKYNPSEWGGTETAVQRLFEGLRQHGVSSVAYCPHIKDNRSTDPLSEAGFDVKRFRACVPVWGISPKLKRQMIAVGGNLISFDLTAHLLREPKVSVMHAHTMGRLGGITMTAALLRRIPFVVTIHGGLLDLPDLLKNSFHKPKFGGWEWGKLFGFLLRSRQLLNYADAIITCNRNEAALLRKQYPGKKIAVQPHGVPTRIFSKDHRATAQAAYPTLRNKRFLLSVGRLDPVKNQAWLIHHSTELLQRHPDIMLVLAGACTHETYGEELRREICRRGLQDRVLLTGGLPPGDPRLIGLFQSAEAVVLPSISETFGLVIIEAWAAGATVISSSTSGAHELIQHGENGWFFDLETPETFYRAVDCVLQNPDLKARQACVGGKLARTDYDTTILAGRMKNLYAEAINENYALRHSTR